MKILFMFLTITCLAFLSTNSNAQAPSGFVKGSVTLSNGTTVIGYIKESIKTNAAISFLDTEGKNKQQYEGSQINAATVDTISYRCIKGDFFKVISNGKICFFQKASNAAGKASYNGTEALFTSGTEGKIGDYFAYSNSQLTHLTKKTVNIFITEQLSNNTSATEKAKAANGDMALLADAITIYNNSNK